MMYVIFKEEVTDSGAFETTFMFPYIEQINAMRVNDLVESLNGLVPSVHRAHIKVRALRVGDFEVDFTRPGEDIFVVARTRKGCVEEILDAYTDDMSSCVTLLNKEVNQVDVAYVGQWIKGSLC